MNIVLAWNLGLEETISSYSTIKIVFHVDVDRKGAKKICSLYHGIFSLPICDHSTNTFSYVVHVIYVISY